MKINEYNQMMAYLTKPDKKPVIPKSKPKKSTREAYKEYLEIRPFLDAESQMFIEKELGFAMGGSVETPKRGLVDGPGSYAGEEKLVLGPNKGMYPLQLRNTETGKWKTEYFKTKAERIARQKKYDAKLQPRNFYKIPKERRDLLQKYATDYLKSKYPDEFIKDTNDKF